MSRLREDQGQSAVEVALVLPFVVLLLMAVIQVGLVVRDHVLVVHAAREAARTAAVADGRDGPTQAALESSGLDASRMEIEVGPRGEPGSKVTVTVRYSAPTNVPLVGALIGDIAVAATATMRVEGG